MLDFEIRVKNADSLHIAFAGLVGKIKDWRALWPAVINQICKAEERAFSTQGQLSAHGEWQALSPAYEKAKRRKYGDQMIETASGRLRAALTGHTADTIEDLKPLRMRWGARILTKNRKWDIATLQQTGTETMPARRLIDLTAEDRAVIQKQIQREAINFSRRLGFKIAMKTGQLDLPLSQIRRLGVQALNEGVRI